MVVFFCSFLLINFIIYFLILCSFDVVIPVMRGYDGVSVDSEGHVLTMRVVQLVDDLSCIVDSLTRNNQTVHIVGHDWGAVVADAFDWKHPGVAKTITVMAVPPNFVIGITRLPSQVS